MTLEERVGLQLVVGLPGPRLSSTEAAHLRAIHAGGFIPFARNFQSPDQFRSLVHRIAEALGREPLVMVDHEGGRIGRFAEGVTKFPGALDVGTTQTPDAARRQGEIEAQELRALKVQVNLAPCLDVLVDGADPVIGTRSYGADPARVAAFGVARIRGLQGQGVAACAKHFPGIGAVPNDPHTHLPTVELSWDEMRRAHLRPFIEAIRAGVETVMSSHVWYPRLLPGPVTPATFSPRLMRDLLRDELGFDGVTVSDDLEMGALREFGSMGESAVRAVEAGHDLLLICSHLGRQREAFDALCAAYRTGRLAEGARERSIDRISRLRPRLSVSSP